MSRHDRIEAEDAEREEREFVLEEYENAASFHRFIRNTVATDAEDAAEVLSAVCAAIYNVLVTEVEPEISAEKVDAAIGEVWRAARTAPFLVLERAGKVTGVAGRGRNEKKLPAVNGGAKPSWTTYCEDAARQYARDAAVEASEREPRGSV